MKMKKSYTMPSPAMASLQIQTSSILVVVNEETNKHQPRPQAIRCSHLSKLLPLLSQTLLETSCQQYLGHQQDHQQYNEKHGSPWAIVHLLCRGLVSHFRIHPLTKTLQHSPACKHTCGMSHVAFVTPQSSYKR